MGDRKFKDEELSINYIKFSEGKLLRPSHVVRLPCDLFISSSGIIPIKLMVAGLLAQMCISEKSYLIGGDL